MKANLRMRWDQIADPVRSILGKDSMTMEQSMTRSSHRKVRMVRAIPTLLSIVVMTAPASAQSSRTYSDVALAASETAQWLDWYENGRAGWEKLPPAGRQELFDRMSSTARECEGYVRGALETNDVDPSALIAFDAYASGVATPMSLTQLGPELCAKASEISSREYEAIGEAVDAARESKKVDAISEAQGELTRLSDRANEMAAYRDWFENGAKSNRRLGSNAVFDVLRNWAEEADSCANAMAQILGSEGLERRAVVDFDSHGSSLAAPVTVGEFKTKVCEDSATMARRAASDLQAKLRRVENERRAAESETEEQVREVELKADEARRAAEEEARDAEELARDPSLAFNEAQRHAHETLKTALAVLNATNFNYENPDYNNIDVAGNVLSLENWVKEQKECIAAAQALLAAGVSSSFEVGDGIELGDLADDVCLKHQATAEALLEKKKAEAEVFLDSYTSVLGGDKRQVFLEVGMADRAVRGPGGRNLRTPDDFADATVWYTYGNVADSFPKRWYVQGWIFEGNDLVSEYSDEDFGDEPPSRAFPEAGSAGGGGFIVTLFWLALLVVLGLIGVRRFDLNLPGLEAYLAKASPLKKWLDRVPTPAAEDAANSVLVDFASLRVGRGAARCLVAPPGFAPNSAIAMEGPTFVAAAEQVAAVFESVLATSPRTTVLARSQDGLRFKAVQRQFPSGLPDYIDIAILPAIGASSAAIYSRCLYPVPDFGANAKRVHTWLAEVEKRLV
jgi:hypothetical protein